MANVYGQAPALLDFGASLTIVNVARFRQMLVDALEARESVVIDLPEDAEVDLSFIQLIESARLSAAIQKKEISTNAPARGRVLSVLQRAGFTTDMPPESRAFWLHERTSI